MKREGVAWHPVLLKNKTHFVWTYATRAEPPKAFKPKYPDYSPVKKITIDIKTKKITKTIWTGDDCMLGPL
jgi:hypothetical protein